MISNLDSQLEDNPNLNTLPVSLAPFNKNNNAYSFLMGNGGQGGEVHKTLKISPYLVLTFFWIWDGTLKKDNAKCNNRYGSNICMRQRMNILGKLIG